MNLKTVMIVAMAGVFATPLLAQMADRGTPGGFGTLDRNQDGYISRDEAREAPWSSRFGEFDRDNDGRLSLGEYDAMRQSAAIGASVDKVESGSKLVADAGSTMGEIVASVQRVTDIIGEISAAANEQSQGIGQVNTAVTQLDQMTQQNAALVEQSAAAAESMKDQAARLAEVVGTFKLG